MEGFTEILRNIEGLGKSILLDIDRENGFSRNTIENTLKLKNMLQNLENFIPISIYVKYKDYFHELVVFCEKCAQVQFAIQNRLTLVSSLELFLECMSELIMEYSAECKVCTCCGNAVVYLPASNENNMEEYYCPLCNATEMDRKIRLFFTKAGLEEAAEGFHILQIGVSTNIADWIQEICPQVVYESIDFVKGEADRNMNLLRSIAEQSIDLIICLPTFTETNKDRELSVEFSRILKDEGIVLLSLAEQSVKKEGGWEEGFHIKPLGIDYFGKDTYEQAGLAKTSLLCALTKSEQTVLSLKEDIVINQKLCENGPLVSVLFPCYNHEEYVEAAILSVIDQTYKNIEILVLDDGSTDASVEILKKYSKYYKVEKYYQENKGGRTRELQQYAEGKYIALMHSDDLWDKNKIALQVEYMEKHPDCDVCLSWCEYIDENEDAMEDYIFRTGNASSYEWMLHFWKNGNCLCNPSSLTRRGTPVFPSAIGYACRQLPDFFKWLEVIQHGNIHIIPKILIRMRRHNKPGNENQSADTNDNRKRHWFEWGNWFYVIRDMESRFFLETFKEMLLNPNAETEDEILCEKFFLLLYSEHYLLQQSAMIWMQEMFKKLEPCLLEKYHYSKKNLFEDEFTYGMNRIMN